MEGPRGSEQCRDDCTGDNFVHKTAVSQIDLKLWSKKAILTTFMSIQACRTRQHLGPPNMGSLLIIVVKLYSYKDSNVGNLRKIKYFRDYFRPSHKTWNTIELAIFKTLDHLLKDSIYTPVSPFSVLPGWYCSWPDKEGGSRGIAGYNSLREELLVLNARAIFCLFVFFCWNDFSPKQINHMLAVRYWNFYSPPPPLPPQAHHDLTCSHF